MFVKGSFRLQQNLTLAHSKQKKAEKDFLRKQNNQIPVIICEFIMQKMVFGNNFCFHDRFHFIFWLFTYMRFIHSNQNKKS
ncbi:MAG: hypothetical protein EA393_04040 [Bacteroidetes bacterium]|nr:MAG: hypothetical protein EA393_04040 [Bacteroidota bacterium]